MLTLPGVGLNERVPVKEAGILKLPHRSVPKARGTHFTATKAASPPELPPHDLLSSNGFLAVPHTLLSVWIEKAP